MSSVPQALTDLPSHSFADSNRRCPTSSQTPTSAVFPSPVFETPKPGQGSFADAGGWTPRFAEDYSVFNSTPGNLRGTQGPFVDFGPATPASRHKRLLSAETAAAEIAAHVNHFSPNPNLPLPPVEPSRRLASSPNSVTVPQEYRADSTPLPSPDPSKQPQSSKKARKTDKDAEPSQTATPPPTGRRGERKLTDKLNMQNDQSFGQPDFTGASQQQHDIAALMATGDMFGYPMTVPVTGPGSFWDPSMSMEFDFNASPSNVFNSTPVHSHRHTGSFDWNSEIPLFQDPSAPFPQSNPEPAMQPVRRERTIAPKPLGPTPGTTAASAAMSAALAVPMDDPFGIAQPANGVNPGLVFGSTQSTFIDNPALIPVTQAGSAEATIFQSRSRTPLGDDIRRTASVTDLRVPKGPDRALAPSPVKSNPRPGLGRSFSENRGKRTQTQNRPVLPKLAPAARPVSQASNGSNSDTGRPIARPTGRLSPMKSQHRLSSLASIPEAQAPLQQPRTRTAVKFTIDSRGRARAETTVVRTESDWSGDISFQRTSRDRSRTRDLGYSDDDDSSSDDEPIIIPSRNNSFNASFALPDPVRPVGSIFHSSRRSVSDRSTSSIGGHDGMGGSPHDVESEAETVMHDHHDKVGDAASELRKVMEDRRKRSSQMGNAGQHRFLQTNHHAPFRGDTISPSTLTDSSLERHEIRCVCSRKVADWGTEYMVQCESCEMWLHGKCTKLNARTRPRLYICAFCANTPNTSMRGGRLRDRGRGNVAGAGSGPSPMANKSFTRAFR